MLQKAHKKGEEGNGDPAFHSRLCRRSNRHRPPASVLKREGNIGICERNSTREET